MSENNRFKFRVWNVQDQEYIYLSLINKDRLSDFAYFADEVTPDYDEQVKCSESNCWALIIEQCTGLKDKNGNLIYEGDIVHYVKHTNLGIGGNRYAKVFWWENIQGFAIETNYGDYYGLTDFEIEIVGTIHENGDLLK